MTKSQFNRAVRIIRKDAKGIGYWLDRRTGKTCAIGGLCLKSGMSKRQLLKADWREVEEHLHKEFGIGPSERYVIQDTNDRWHGIRERRIKVIEVLKRFVA